MPIVVVAAHTLQAALLSKVSSTTNRHLRKIVQQPVQGHLIHSEYCECTKASISEIDTM